METIYFLCFNNYWLNYRIDFYQAVAYPVIKLMKGESVSYLVKLLLYAIIQSSGRRDTSKWASRFRSSLSSETRAFGSHSGGWYQGLCIQNCICHWMALTSKPHPQVRLPSSLGQQQQGCCGVRRASPQGDLCSGGKEITDYLNEEYSFIPVTLWGLFWGKQESLGKGS